MTQCATLDDAPPQVRDYLDTAVPDINHEAWTVIVRVLPNPPDQPHHLGSRM